MYGGTLNLSRPTWWPPVTLFYYKEIIKRFDNNEIKYCPFKNFNKYMLEYLKTRGFLNFSETDSIQHESDPSSMLYI